MLAWLLPSFCSFPVLNPLRACRPVEVNVQQPVEQIMVNKTLSMPKCVTSNWRKTLHSDLDRWRPPWLWRPFTFPLIVDDRTMRGSTYKTWMPSSRTSSKPWASGIVARICFYMAELNNKSNMLKSINENRPFYTIKTNVYINVLRRKLLLLSSHHSEEMLLGSLNRDQTVVGVSLSNISFLCVCVCMVTRMTLMSGSTKGQRTSKRKF